MSLNQVYALRARQLEKLNALTDDQLAVVKRHYQLNTVDFINDWGMTIEPRNIQKKLPVALPFILFPKQVECIHWMEDLWVKGERGLVEKSRDFGLTWLACAFACSKFLFNDGFIAGFGSRKEELVDKKGDASCIFEKMRFFLDSIPRQLQPAGYDREKHALFRRIVNPENGSSIVGEAGDDIGRGGRTSIYFMDEAAFHPRQDQVDAALSQTTNCQIDISTPNGTGNAFYKKRMGGKIPVFICDWRDDPRKDQAWYDKQVREQDEVTVAQEIDRDYNASAENIFIPPKWVEASIDAHEKLGWDPSGCKVVAYDPADTGDAKALGYRYGSLVADCRQLKKGDIREAMLWASSYTTSLNPDGFVYDGDGMGAPAVKLSLDQDFEDKDFTMDAFHGGGEVRNKERHNPKHDKTNGDAFLNLRAQAYSHLRDRFEATYNAVVNGVYCDPEQMISISSEIKDLNELKAELVRPQRQYTNNGKIKVESKADMKKRGVQSPNMADVIMMLFAYQTKRKKKATPKPQAKAVNHY